MTSHHAIRAPFIRMLPALGLLAALAGPTQAHEFKLESLMNAFVKLEAQKAHLVIRLPLHITRTIKFPVNGALIDVANSGPALQQALNGLGQDITLWEDGEPLVPLSAIGRLSLPSDRSFERYETAAAHVAKPAEPDQGIYVEQGYLDAHITYAIRSPASSFAIRTRVAPELKDYLKLAVRYLPPGEEGRALIITSRSGRVALNPAWYQAGAGFVLLGITHILGGIDHLLFLLCLVIPFLRFRQVLAIVTAFTLAHSFTLIGSAYGLAPGGDWFPPFVETAIAASIVYMALENIAGVDLRRRWLITALFGLVHGFGFSYGLKENLQFAGHHLLVALLSFNIGIELGQIGVLAVLLPVLALLRRSVLAGRVGVVVLSALVAHTGWHWMAERADILWKTPWPQLDGAALVTLGRWVAGLLLAFGAVRWIARRAGTLLSRKPVPGQTS